MAGNEVTIILKAVDLASQKIKTVANTLAGIGQTLLAMGAIDAVWQGAVKAMDAATKAAQEYEKMGEKVTENQREQVEALHEQVVAAEMVKEAHLNLWIEAGRALNEYRTELDITRLAIERLKEQGISELFVGQGGKAFQDQLDQMEEVIRAEVRAEAAARNWDGEVSKLKGGFSTIKDTINGIKFDQILTDVNNVQGAMTNWKTAVDNYHTALDEVGKKFKSGEIDSSAAQEELGKITKEFDKGREAAALWVKQFILSLVQAQLAADGKLSDADFQAILGIGSAMGVISPEVAETVQNVISAINSADATAVQTALDDMANLFEYDGEAIDLKLTFNGEQDPFKDFGPTPQQRADIEGVASSLSTITPANADSVEKIKRSINDIDPSKAKWARDYLREIIGMDGKTVTVNVNVVDSSGVPAP